MTRKISTISGILLLICTLIACDDSGFYDENRVIKNGIWDSRDKKEFEITITDTLSRYTFFLNIRNDESYPFSNLYLFIHTKLPDGARAVDTVECLLADPDGKWRGEGIGSLKMNRFEFRRGLKFPRKGKYVFQIEQGMRKQELNGIRDVGIRIEKEK